MEKNWVKKVYTLNRLETHWILKIEDELAVQETKIVWKWEKNKLPLGTKQLLIEKQDSRFERYPRASQNSINFRLSKRAENSIKLVKNIKSKKAVVQRTKSKFIAEKYKFTCRNRGCYICRE